MGEFVLYLTLGLTPLAFFVINTLVNNKREDKKELEKNNYEAGFKDAVNHIECLLYELADGSDSLCPAKVYIKVMGEVLELKAKRHQSYVTIVTGIICCGRQFGPEK
jgi:hypothetical protein